MIGKGGTVIHNVFEQAEITPSEIPAGDSDEFVIKLVAGSGYTGGPSRLMLDFSGRLGSSCPTRLVNEASGYVETHVGNPDVTYTMRIWDMARRRFVDREHPASREGGRMLVLDLSEGMQPGDAIEIHWGETTRGFGPGAKATTVVPKPGYRDSVRIRYFEGRDKGLPDYGASYPGCERPEADAEIEVTYAVTPRELRRLRLIRKWNKALLIPHDRFWNVAKVDNHDEVVDADAPAKKNEQGVYEFDSPHVHVKSKSAPLIDSPTMDDVFEGKNLYWGDLHAHSHHSIDCTRTVRMEMMPDDLMRFARDRAGLDFVAVTDHHTPAGGRGSMIQQDQWMRLVENVREYNSSGDFVVFPGFELSCPRGDTVVVFNGEPDYEVIDRDAVFDAYRGRQIYATSNARIRLIFLGNGQLMGSVVRNQSKKTLHIDIAGESALKKVEVFRNGDLYKRFAPSGLIFKTDLVVEEDEPSNWYLRVTQLDNHIAVASPIWFEEKQSISDV